MSQIWLANLVSASVLIAVMGYFIRRYINQQDKKLAVVEEKVEEIEKNYIHRFEEVKETQHRVKDEILRTLGSKIEETNRDKMQYRVDQAKDMGEMRTEIRHLTEAVRDMGRDRKP